MELLTSENLMCGICGEFNLANQDVTPEHIKGMTDVIAHRGPDDWGIYCDHIIGLGHRRLSIIDLSPNGRQPMWSHDRSLCIVFNGEVYNYQEIRKDLLSRGYHFISTSDTEVVVNAIHCYGIKRAVSKFIGMFAFAVWDNKEKILYLCRDRAGIKPLYYYFTNDLLLFGSELKALLSHPQFRKEINPLALGQYFVTGYFLDHFTVFNNTFKLSPGHYLTINRNGKMRLTKYWGFETIERDSWHGTFEDAAEQLEDIFTSAFGYRLIADVPVGLFLSGGIDSSLVSAILKKNLNTDILNITIGFHEEAYNEAPKAQRVSEQIGARQIVHYVNTDEAQNTLLKFPEIYDEPFGDTSGIPTYILSKLARQHVTVALSADGGDEQFCGYEDYASYQNYYALITKIPLIIRIIISRFLKYAVPYTSLLSKMLSKSNGMRWKPQLIARYEKMLGLLNIQTLPDLIRLMNEKAWTQNAVNQLFAVKKDDIFKGTVLSNSYLSNYSEDIMDMMMRTDYQMFLRDDILTKVDRASMSVSLECRDPMLDHRIAEKAFSFPIQYLFKNGKHKRILKYILRKWLSDDILKSPKRGFMIPLYYWLKGVWKPVVMEYLSREKVCAVGVLNEKMVEREVIRFYKYHGCRAEKIWMMLNFQMWAERWYLN